MGHQEYQTWDDADYFYFCTGDLPNNDITAIPKELGKLYLKSLSLKQLWCLFRDVLRELTDRKTQEG